MRKLILAAISIAASALAGPALAQSPIVIKFSHVVASKRARRQLFPGGIGMIIETCFRYSM